jgi:hypothetical protein
MKIFVPRHTAPEPATDGSAALMVNATVVMARNIHHFQPVGCMMYLSLAHFKIIARVFKAK